MGKTIRYDKTHSFEKCSLCGDSNIDWEATVYFSGEEVACHELDTNIFVEEGMSSDSSRCEMCRSFYAETCCVQVPEKPCNLCTSQTGDHFNMNTNARVSYDRQVKTCLEVYHSLYSRREQTSEHCAVAQGQLFDQCCEAFLHQGDGTGQTIPEDSVVEASSTISLIPTVAPMTLLKSAPDLDTWYKGAMKRSSPVAMTVVSVFSLSPPLIAVGLTIILSC